MEQRFLPDLNAGGFRAEYLMTPLEPYRQGALDELCGLYALFNASRLANQLLEDEECEKVFALALRWLSEKKDFRHTLYKGLYGPELRSLYEGVFQNRWKTFTLKQPWGKSKPQNANDFWSRMEKEASRPNQGMVIAITADDKEIDHWSVVRKITKEQIFLFDSYHPELHPSRRDCGYSKKCGLKYVIWAEEVLLLRNNR